MSTTKAMYRGNMPRSNGDWKLLTLHRKLLAVHRQRNLLHHLPPVHPGPLMHQWKPLAVHRQRRLLHHLPPVHPGPLMHQWMLLRGPTLALQPNGGTIGSATLPRMKTGSRGSSRGHVIK